jgi:hypothetical protein
LRNLPSKSSGELPQGSASCGKQTVFFVGTLDALEGWAFTVFLAYLPLTFEAGQCSFFRVTKHRRATRTDGGQCGLKPATQLTKDAGAFGGFFCWRTNAVFCPERSLVQFLLGLLRSSPHALVGSG